MSVIVYYRAISLVTDADNPVERTVREPVNSLLRSGDVEAQSSE